MVNTPQPKWASRFKLESSVQSQAKSDDSDEEIVEDGWKLVSRSQHGLEDRDPEGKALEVDHKSKDASHASGLDSPNHAQSSHKLEQALFWPSIRKAPHPDADYEDLGSNEGVPPLQLPETPLDGPPTTSKGARWRRRLSREPTTTPGPDQWTKNNSFSDSQSSAAAKSLAPAALQSSSISSTPRPGVGRFSLAGSSNWTPTPKTADTMDSPPVPLFMSPLKQNKGSFGASTASQSRPGSATGTHRLQDQSGLKSAQPQEQRRHWWVQQEACMPSETKHRPDSLPLSRFERLRRPISAAQSIENGMDLDDDFADPRGLDMSLSPLDAKQSHATKTKTRDSAGEFIQEHAQDSKPSNASECAQALNDAQQQTSCFREPEEAVSSRQSVESATPSGGACPVEGPEQSNNSAERGNSDEDQQASSDLWVCLRRLSMPGKRQLDYPHLDNAVEMVSRRTFEGWEEAMKRLESLQLDGNRIAKSQEELASSERQEAHTGPPTLCPAEKDYRVDGRRYSPPVFISKQTYRVPPVSEASGERADKLQQLMALQQQGDKFAALFCTAAPS